MRVEQGWSRIKVLGKTGMAGVSCRCQKGKVGYRDAGVPCRCK